MPFRLPVFPLSVVLFPGTPLPLHIFEPRSKRLVADCLLSDRGFGITPVDGSSEPVLPDDPSSLSFAIAGGIECDLGVNRRLLAERSTVRRLKALRLLLPVLTSRIESALKVHRRAHPNGKGGPLPDVLAQ
jgi:ATP-dependent protease La (Lon)-like substrate-binding protein